ncbi:hypothetical protein D3C73_978410 [compost metagenome]
MQGARFEQGPHFLGVLGLFQLRRKPAEIGRHVAHIPLQHAERVVVARRVHGLRQVDDHRAGRSQQHVELGQVTVHQAGTQHQHDLRNQKRVILACLVRLQHHVVQTRRGIAVLVGHQFHQQHAFKEVIRLGHSHTGVGQAEQCCHFGVLPGVFGFLATKLGTLGHGPGLTAVAHLAAFLILGRLTETAFVRLLVDLRAT